MIKRSQRVRAADFDSDWFKYLADELKQESGRYHRKIWEFVVTAQVFTEHVLGPARNRWQHTSTKPNIHALGFGCGKEPIPKWLSDLRVSVVATDASGIDPGWDDTDQRSHSLADLGLDNDNRFVEFREVDMNSIPADLLQGQFDFTWSCGSFEHIGGIDQSIDFFRNQMRCLKPGGIACHTTEFKSDSASKWPLSKIWELDPTIDTANLCLLRRQDLARLAGDLWAQGDKLWLPDLKRGDTEIDGFVDRPPYTAPHHLNIEIGGYVTTSIVLIATRGTGDTRS